MIYGSSFGQTREGNNVATNGPGHDIKIDSSGLKTWRL